jgi:maltose alpha-D-glucosyltransferase/alpha-amylase
VLALEYRWRGNAIVCVHNLAPEPRDAALRIGRERLVDLRDREELTSDAGGVHRVALAPYGYRWLRHGRLTQALARERV